jgi:hypothetical protein
LEGASFVFVMFPAGYSRGGVFGAGIFARPVGEKGGLKGGDARRGGLPVVNTFFPRPYDEVSVAGRTGMFRVILINYEAQTVELLKVPRANSVLIGVPFSELRPVEGDEALWESEPPA